MSETSNFHIGATPDDHAWYEMTKDNRAHLDSKDFEDPRYEKMKYSPYVEQIADIIEQEVGFRPDLRVGSLQDFEAFKRRQKLAIALSGSGKEKDEKGRTLADHLEVMRMDVGTIIMHYTGDAWTTWKEAVAKKNNVPVENVRRFLDPYLYKVRDRLASEIPVLDE